MRIKNLMKTLAATIVGVAVWSPSCPVEAATVTLSFDADSGFSRTGYQNATENGFRISANNYLDYLNEGFFTSGIVSSGNGIVAVDSMAPGGWENEFLGPPSLAYDWNEPLGVIYIDFPEHKFQLESVLVWYRGRIISSKGGDTGWFGDVFLPWEGHDPEALPSVVEFDAPDWQGLDWIALFGGSGEPHGGYDAITLQVPEPISLALFGLALSGLAISRRR